MEKDLSNYLSYLPPGFRFEPTDKELLGFYLMKKLKNEPLPLNQILEIDIYQHSPKQLTDAYKDWGVYKNSFELEEGTWYFFTPRNQKYPNGKVQANRLADDGYWKATGNEEIKDDFGQALGNRKSLVFNKGKPQKPEKTNWIMHEYTLSKPSDLQSQSNRNPNDHMKLDGWVLCRIHEHTKNKTSTHDQKNHRSKDKRDLPHQEKENNNEHVNVCVDLQALPEESQHKSNDVSCAPELDKFIEHLDSMLEEDQEKKNEHVDNVCVNQLALPEESELNNIDVSYTLDPDKFFQDLDAASLHVDCGLDMGYSLEDMWNNSNNANSESSSLEEFLDLDFTKWSTFNEDKGSSNNIKGDHIHIHNNNKDESGVPRGAIQMGESARPCGCAAGATSYATGNAGNTQGAACLNQPHGATSASGNQVRNNVPPLQTNVAALPSQNHLVQHQFNTSPTPPTLRLPAQQFYPSGVVTDHNRQRKRPRLLPSSQAESVR